jgi:serine/threonine-protein kinase
MSAPVREGDVVLDKYRVERVLGKGGMGVVVAATHLELDQRVALKFLLPGALEHPDIVERFAREARAAAKIQSQHVARVIDTGRMPAGTPFMVMEYLEGSDLADVLEKEGRMPIPVAVDYLLQASEAIAEAHAAGIVHRDLKPSNLFLAKQRDRRAIVKVLDFGISKVDDPKSAPLTRTATMMGSPHYMSPEQLTSSKNVDARTDIWSLGVILYELVAGNRPFEAETMPEIVAQILQNVPPRLNSYAPEVTLDFERVVSRCLSTFAQDRFASVAELAAELRPFAPDAVSAQASIAKISRILGGNSLPPGGPAPVAASEAAASMAQTLAAQAVDATKLVPAPLASPTAPVLVRGNTPAPPRVAGAVTSDVIAARPGRTRRRASIGAFAGGVALAVAAALHFAPRSSTAAAPPTSATAIGLVESPAPPPASAAVIVAPAAESAPAVAALPVAAPKRVTTSPNHPRSTHANNAAASNTSSPKKSPLDMGIK